MDTTCSMFYAFSFAQLLLFFLGEYHSNNPEMSKLLHKAVREKSETAYAVYQQHLANRPVNVSTI